MLLLFVQFPDHPTDQIQNLLGTGDIIQFKMAEDRDHTLGTIPVNQRDQAAHAEGDDPIAIPEKMGIQGQRILQIHGLDPEETLAEHLAVLIT